MQLITDEYRKLNTAQHETNSTFGTSGQRYAADVLSICDKQNIKDILDYGCGKCTLGNSLPFSIKQYDPAIEKYSADPMPADLVVCTDVMEHIEPELLDNVLTHLASKVKKLAYISIATRPAVKILADGRNAHLIVEGIEFWVGKMQRYLNIMSVINQKSELIMICVPHGENKND